MFWNASTYLILCMNVGLPAAAGKNAPAISRCAPNWRVGDRWTVLTVQRMDWIGKVRPREQAVRWRFRVASAENLAGTATFRVEAHPEKQQSPKVELWIDRKTYSMRQLRLSLTIGGRTRTVTESYRHSGKAHGPTITFLSALPLELPAFSQSRQASAFLQISAAQPAGSKSNETAFATTVTQVVTRLTPPPATKGVANGFFKWVRLPNDLVAVSLTNGRRRIDQVWKPGLPWPAVSVNGSVQSRLVSFTRKRR